MRDVFLILLMTYLIESNSCVPAAADSHCRYEKSQCKKLDCKMACSRHGTINLAGERFLGVAANQAQNRKV